MIFLRHLAIYYLLTELQKIWRGCDISKKGREGRVAVAVALTVLTPSGLMTADKAESVFVDLLY